MPPALDRMIDPTTGDFVAAPRGSFVAVDVLANKLGLSFTVPLGSWEGDPLLGHRLGELAREKNTPDTIGRVKLLLAAAVKWLVDAGELDHVDVNVESFSEEGVAFEVDAFPAHGRPPLTGLSFFVAFGGA